MSCTAVQDRSGLTLELIKPMLRLAKTDTTWDVQLELYLDEALEGADSYCNNPFLDAEGADRKIPAKVKAGCIEWVRMRFNMIKLDEDADGHFFNSRDDDKHVGSLREGQTIKSITRDLGDGVKEVTSFNTSEASRLKGKRIYTEHEIRREFWSSYRMTPGF